MFQNIFLIILLILLFFFISNEPKINDILSKRYVKYFILLVIVYFIYENYNFILLIVSLLVVIYFNIDIKEKFVNNRFLQNIKENFSDFSLNLGNDGTENTNKKQNIEPFKDKVIEIKNLFDNIKNEIKKIV